MAHSPLSFFEETPAGDITARFAGKLTSNRSVVVVYRPSLTDRLAGDTDAVDSQLPGMVSGLADGVLSMATGLLVAIGAAPLFIFALPPIGVAYWWVARRYRGPAKALKALDNQSKGPVWTLCSEALEGIESVRSYGLSAHFAHECCVLLDANNRARYSWE